VSVVRVARSAAEAAYLASREHLTKITGVEREIDWDGLGVADKNTWRRVANAARLADTEDEAVRDTLALHRLDLGELGAQELVFSQATMAFWTEVVRAARAYPQRPEEEP
jgi:hypothetical protein